MTKAKIETERLDVLLQNSEETLLRFDELIEDADEEATKRGLRDRKEQIEDALRAGREAMDEAKN